MACAHTHLGSGPGNNQVTLEQLIVFVTGTLRFVAPPCTGCTGPSLMTTKSISVLTFSVLIFLPFSSPMCLKVLLKCEHLSELLQVPLGATWTGPVILHYVDVTEDCPSPTPGHYGKGLFHVFFQVTFHVSCSQDHSEGPRLEAPKVMQAEICTEH
jgi:hypothetical protein